MADSPLDFFKALNTSALIDAAKYGGYAPVDLNNLTAGKTSKLGGLADIMLPALHAALPNSPLFTLANGARQAFNLNQYNKQAQQQALYALQQEALKNQNNATIYNKRTGMNVSGPFDPTIANDAAPDIRKDNALPSLQSLLNGESLQLAQNADYDPALIRDYLGQQSKATDFVNRNMGMDGVQSGQQGSLISQGLGKMVQDKMAQAGLDGSFLSAGISKSRPAQQIDTGISPYMMPTDLPAQFSGLLKAGLDDAQAYGQQKETNRHNTTTETETAKNHRATEGIGWYNAKSGRISAMKSGGGGSQPSEATRAYELWKAGKLSDAEYKRTLGAVGADPADRNFETLKSDVNATISAYGAKSNEAKAAAQRLSDYVNQKNTQQYLQGADLGGAASGMMTSPVQMLGGGGGRAPFGNKSVAKLGSVKNQLGLKW